MVQSGAIVTMEDQHKVVCDLSIGAIFNDLERPPNPHFTVRLRQNSTLNMSLMVHDRRSC